jgi:hypothetical protein
MATRSERSSAAFPASGLPITAQAAARERDHGAVDAERIHARDLPGRIEESAIEPEMHAAHVYIDAVTVPGSHGGIEFPMRQHVAEHRVRNEMAVNVRDHCQSPR